mgnify:FL=1
MFSLRINIHNQHVIMRYLIYLILISFLVSCSKKEENTSKSTETEKTVAVQEPTPELQLEVVNPSTPSPELKFEISGNNAVIVRYTGTAENFIIPDEIEGIPVTEIRARAFENCSSLKSITIGGNVTTIGKWAFSGCTGITSIEIPEKVESIGNLAFDKCSALESINVSENNDSYSSEEGVLYDSGKTKIVQCPLGKSGDLNVARGVKYIDDFAFRSCTKINTINLTDEVLMVGNGAFSGCSSLSTVYLPNSITSIGQMAFYKCENLTDIKIPSKVKSIGAQTFSGSGLRSVQFSSGITSISKGAFFDCKGLASVTIPESVKSIGRGAFSRCANLESVTFLGDAPSASSDAFAGTSPTIYYTAGTEGWSEQFSGLNTEETPSQP